MKPSTILRVCQSSSRRSKVEILLGFICGIGILLIILVVIQIVKAGKDKDNHYQ